MYHYPTDKVAAREICSYLMYGIAIPIYSMKGMRCRHCREARGARITSDACRSLPVSLVDWSLPKLTAVNKLINFVWREEER